MKKINSSSLVLALIMTVFLFSCKKEDPKPAAPTIDPRDKFVGTWKGDLLVLVNGETDSQPYTFVISKNPTNNTKIIINNDGVSNNATVNGNTFTYEQFSTNLDNGNGGVINATFTGTGTINGNSLSESGNLSYVVDNQTSTGTWSRNSAKQ